MRIPCVVIALVLGVACAPRALAAEDSTGFQDVLTAVKAPSPEHELVLTRAIGIDRPDCCRPWCERINWFAAIYAWLPDISGVTWSNTVGPMKNPPS